MKRVLEQMAAECSCKLLYHTFGSEAVVEPTVTKRNLAKYPGMDDELRVPNFISYVLRRP